MAHQRRTGIPSILRYARILCDFIQRYTSIIKLVTSNHPATMAALAAVLAACQVLEDELENWVEAGV
jgi:hypothetical protein